MFKLQGDVGNAKAAYRQAITLDPDDGTAYQNLMACHPLSAEDIKCMQDATLRQNKQNKEASERELTNDEEEERGEGGQENKEENEEKMRRFNKLLKTHEDNSDSRSRTGCPQEHAPMQSSAEGNGQNNGGARHEEGSSRSVF